MRAQSDILASLADRQYGRVTHRQLLAEGIDRGRITRWLADKRLRPVHHGVYAVGHRAPSSYADLVAALLACGDGAAASHASAGHLLGILRVAPPQPEVTVPTTAGRERTGIRIHRVRRLPVLDVCTFHGIAVTTVPRALLDLAPRLAVGDLTRACHEAWIRHGTTALQIEACIARNPHKPGAGCLRQALGRDVTLSYLEDGFLALLRRHGLPIPRTNVDCHGDKVDCHWPEHDLTVELQSYRFHATRHAFEADVARRRRSKHIAYSYGDVFEREAQTAADVARRLKR